MVLVPYMYVRASPNATMGTISVKLNYVYFAAYKGARLSKSNVLNRRFLRKKMLQFIKRKIKQCL